MGKQGIRVRVAILIIGFGMLVQGEEHQRKMKGCFMIILRNLMNISKLIDAVSKIATGPTDCAKICRPLPTYSGAAVDSNKNIYITKGTVETGDQRRRCREKESYLAVRVYTVYTKEQGPGAGVVR
jgi:hypothetical protein